MRNPKNINNKRIYQLKKNTSRPSTHGPKATKPILNNNNNLQNNQNIYKGIDIYSIKCNKNQFKTVQQKKDLFNFKK